MRLPRAAFAAAALLAAAASAGAATLRLGATHTLEDSGILAALVPAFEAASGSRVRTLVAGTGQVMKYAEAGDVDVVLTHSRADEERLVARGIGARRAEVMHNDFLIAGPAADPAGVRGLRDAARALARIRDAGARFASRGDDSGTHKMEQSLWSAAGGFSAWPGYLSVGQGAGRTLAMAHELGAYDLVDRATHARWRARAPLPVLVEGDPRLRNAYGVVPLRAAPGRAVDAALAERFAAWLASPRARALIAGFRIEGEAVFHLPPGAAR